MDTYTGKLDLAETSSIKKTSLLILVDWFEPGYKAGGPIRSCTNLVRALEDKFNVYIITSDRDYGDTEPYPGIERDRWNQYTELSKVWYCSQEKQSYKYLKHIISELNPEHIYLNSMYSVVYTLWPLWMKHRRVIQSRIVLAPRGMLQEGAMSFKKNKKRIFLLGFKLLGIQKKITFHATDSQEVEDISLNLGKGLDIVEISNIPDRSTGELAVRLKKPGELKMVSVARISAKKNILFLLKPLKHIETRLSLDIIGPLEDEAYWEQCKTLIQSFEDRHKVSYLGELPYSEIKKVLTSYHLYILPTKGENYGHSIFEALQAGLPVLISDRTPWRYLSSQKAGWDLPLENPTAYTEAIKNMIAFDQEEYNIWSSNAWTYARDIANNSYAILVKKYQILFKYGES